MTDVFFIVSGIGALQCILFMLLLLVKKNRDVSDHILIVWFFVFFAHLMTGISDELSPNSTIKIFLRTIGLLHGPLFFMYAKAIFNQRFSNWDVLHFIPFTLIVLVSFFIPTAFQPSWEIVILFAKLIVLIAYPLYILYTCNRRIQKIKEKKLVLSRRKLSWIRIIAILFLISISIGVIRLSTELLVGVAYFELWDLTRYIILVTVIGFYGLKYGMVYTPEVPSEPRGAKKYRHSPLKTEEVNHFKNVIDTFFKENTAYLQHDFSLATLSNTINIPKHHLSQIINSEMNSTFYDLVNARRIAYAMERMRENHHLTLEGLGYECGFNSKSVFFQNFKKYTGQTPGSFRK